MHKLTIYEKSDDMLLPVHIFFSDDENNLTQRARYHMSLNPSYVSILLSYRVESVKVLNLGESEDGNIQ